MGRLRGRVAIVTGAARGIGRAVARAYAAEGASVWACDVLEEEVAAVVGGIAGSGGRARYGCVDVSSPTDVESFVGKVLAEEGRLDILANIAGVIILKSIEETTPQEWDRVLGVNLKGVFLCARAAVPAMKAQRRGSIINTSSNAGVRGSADETAYCASKFGLEGLSRALAKELAPFNIAVNTITPGTPIHTSMSEITYDAEKRRIWRDPIEIAPAYVHLALQDAKGLSDRYVRAWDLVQTLAAQEGAPV